MSTPRCIHAVQATPTGLDESSPSDYDRTRCDRPVQEVPCPWIYEHANRRPDCPILRCECDWEPAVVRPHTIHQILVAIQILGGEQRGTPWRNGP